MEYKVKNNLKADVKGLKSRLTGTVDLSNVIFQEQLYIIFLNRW